MNKNRLKSDIIFSIVFGLVFILSSNQNIALAFFIVMVDMCITALTIQIEKNEVGEND